MDASYNLTDASFSVVEPPRAKYTIEEVLTMFGGYQYFTAEQISYVYHKSNGNEEQAAYYLALCKEQSAELQNKADRMVDVIAEPLVAEVDAKDLSNAIVYDNEKI